MHATMPAYSLLRFHGPMLHATARIALNALLPLKKGDALLPVQRTIAAPPEQLIEQYLAWCGATGRYPHTLPPHMVSYWGLPVIANILLQTSYPLTKVLNQGITLQIHGDLPRGQPLVCRGFVASLSEEADRTRLSVTVQTGTKSLPNQVEATLHMVFIHQKSSVQKKSTPTDATISWEKLGSWSAVERDGLTFALITGDFNPIHWSTLAGKLSALHTKILQGFGTFARTLELVGTDRVAKIDLRFLRPVPLPSNELHIEQSASQEGQPHQIRLRGQDEQLHLAGTVTYRNGV